MSVRQATAVAIGSRAILIDGEPGSGKSSLALSLIDRGALLVGDDGVVIEPRGQAVLASPHPRTRGLLEVRNLGLLEMPVCDSARVSLAIRLTVDAPRFIDRPGSIDLFGIAIPQILLEIRSPLSAIKAELALARYGIEA